MKINSFPKKNFCFQKNHCPAISSKLSYGDVIDLDNILLFVSVDDLPSLQAPVEYLPTLCGDNMSASLVDNGVSDDGP